jgi:hypothetical protein
LQILENQGKLYCDRLNSGALMGSNENESIWRVNLCKAGTADIFFIVYGRIIFVETKRAKGKQRETQKLFQNKVESVGALYWLVKSFDEFLEKFNTIGVK